MTKEMLKQMESFEIFVEKMEAIVEKVKNDESNIKNGWGIERFDLRDDKMGMIYPLPQTIKDYADIWDYVQKRYKEYLESCKEPFAFFDVYWNDPEVNRAEYDNLTLWTFFDYEFGIYYEGDDETMEKICERGNKKLEKEESLA